MKKYVWGVGIAVLVPWTAIASGGYGLGPERPRPAGVRPAAAEATSRPVRMCQSFRFKDGVPVKIGEPHPCREPRNQRLASNVMGGAVLPQ